MNPPIDPIQPGGGLQTGKCDQCPTFYDVGLSGFKRLGDRCGDLSIKPVSGWPHNACNGRVQAWNEPVDEGAR